jgi:hypothetical protein
MLTDHHAGRLNLSLAPPPSFPAARFVSPWRSHLLSFLHPAASKTSEPPRCHALDAAPDHLVAGHGQIWPGHRQHAMVSELPCFTRGQLAHGQAGNGLGLARLGLRCTMRFIIF